MTCVVARPLFVADLPHHVKNMTTWFFLQPDNIYEFGAQYFTELLRETAGGGLTSAASESLNISDMSHEQLEDLVLNIFKVTLRFWLPRSRGQSVRLCLKDMVACESNLQEFDEDQSGFLDRKEFKKCLTSAKLGLSSREVNAIMAEVDENEDGVIEYAEFMPLAIELLQSMQVSSQVGVSLKQVSRHSTPAAVGKHIAGMSSTCLSAVLGYLVGFHRPSGAERGGSTRTSGEHPHEGDEPGCS